MNTLTGKIAIVSAAGRGIGKGIALALARAGANVIVNSYSEDTTAATVHEVREAGGTATAFAGDATSPEMIVSLIESVIGDHGRIDVLVNNVGAGPKSATPPPDHPLGNIEATWNALYNQNLLPAVLMTEAVAPHMQKQRSGKIINITSIAGRNSLSSGMLRNFTHPSYGAMKAALTSYTQTMAELLGPDNINVNAVAPGIVWTDAWTGNAKRAVKHIPDFQGMDPRQWFEGIFTDEYPTIFSSTPMKREQTVEDIGNAVCFLASDDAMNITGQTLMVDGGMVKI